MVLCRVFGMFCALFCGMFCGLNWEDIVADGQGLFRVGFESKIGVYRSCQGALWHAGAWKPRYCMAGLKNCSPQARNRVGFHAIA